jgi:predicted phosphoribosyltransferase
MADNVIAFMEGVEVRSREEFLVERRRLMEAFPDLVIVADDVVAEGSKVGMASAFLRPIVEYPFEG